MPDLPDLSGDPRPAESGAIQSWYPICLSDEIPRFGIKPFDGFGGRWIIFRNQGGQVSVASRYCPHMGTDLANGSIKGEHLQCPLHHWRFCVDGHRACHQVAAGASQGRLACLPVVERFGMVFVFWGGKPLFDLPATPWLHDPIWGRAKRVSASIPYEAVSLNLFDTQHFYRIHNRRVCALPTVANPGPYQITINFAAEVLPVRWFDKLMRLAGHRWLEVEAQLWGGNLLFVNNRSAGYVALLALRPLSPDRCQLYISIHQERRAGRVRSLLQGLQLQLLTWIAWQFVKPDVPVITGMRPFPGALCEDADHATAFFWKHFLGLPRLSAKTLSSCLVSGEDS